MVASLTAFRELASCREGQIAFGAILEPRNNDRNVNFYVNSEAEWRKSPPLLSCLIKLLRSIDTQEALSTCVIEAIYELSVGSLRFCMDRGRLVLLMVSAFMHLVIFMHIRVGREKNSCIFRRKFVIEIIVCSLGFNFQKLPVMNLLN